ncbi:MAG: ATP-grasp domain-containing protein [Bacteroidia bacterium]|nr:ATP-grasp domain-containing protein [Bacteroidia bacterium]
MKKVLVLFPNDWDKTEFAKEKYRGAYQFFYAGPNLFQFPGFLQLPFFNVHRFISRCLRVARSLKVDAVLSTDEYIGAIVAAIVAKKLGLPHSDPAKIIGAQHKYYSRLAQQQHCSEASVNCDLIPRKIVGYSPSLRFPFFVKPVKGSFSLFAKKVENRAELQNHLGFKWYEQLGFNVLTKPFNQLLSRYSDLEHNANFFVGEELIEGIQVTVDGFVFDKEVVPCGIVDSIMFPGTNIFERFEYPSKLPSEVQKRMFSIVRRLIEGMDFQHAQFNVELFYNAATNHIHIIEINPRLSYQFGDLYENVDGLNTYQILLDLSLGNKPRFSYGNGTFSHTASFVLRTFEGKQLTSVPRTDEIESFNNKYHESNIKIYGKTGTRLSGEMRAIGSYRYGIVNVGAHSLLDLFAIYEDVQDSLPFTFK